MKRLLTAFTILASLVLASVPASAQTAPNVTKLATAMTTSSQTSMSVSSATGFTVGSSARTMAMIDSELVFVQAINGTTISIVRGQAGSLAATHLSGAVVVVGAPQAFIQVDPVGSCTASSQVYLPIYNYLNGRRWNCINSTWMVDTGYAFLGPEACQSSVSGNSSGTNGYTALGTAPSIPVVQASTSVTGTNTHYYVCSLNKLPASVGTLGINRNISLLDVVALYGTQTTALGTQVATLASGTMNSKIVFTQIDYPAAAASETAKGLAEAVRADAGSLTITPVVASFNTGTTTAGEFFSAKFAPAAAIPLQTDLRQYFFTLSLLNTATSATVTNLPGILVHYAYIPD